MLWHISYARRNIIRHTNRKYRELIQTRRDSLMQILSKIEEAAVHTDGRGNEKVQFQLTSFNAMAIA